MSFFPVLAAVLTMLRFLEAGLLPCAPSHQGRTEGGGIFFTKRRVQPPSRLRESPSPSGHTTCTRGHNMEMPAGAIPETGPQGAGAGKPRNHRVDIAAARQASSPRRRVK